MLDAACGAGWRLVLKGDTALARSRIIAARAAEMGLRLIAIANADHDGGPNLLREESGVVTDWFARHACAAAIVRPDHYVYGVAADEAGLAAMLSGLATRLQ